MQRILRPIRDKEWGDAMALVWRVFLQFDSDSYSAEGIDNFYKFITDDILYMMFKQGVYKIFACLDGPEIRGVISARNTNHISLLFVDEKYQHQGIARALVRYLCDFLLIKEGESFVTVDSSPYAVGFYHKIGFKDTAEEQKKDGIVYTPMKFYL